MSIYMLSAVSRAPVAGLGPQPAVRARYTKNIIRRHSSDACYLEQVAGGLRTSAGGMSVGLFVWLRNVKGNICRMKE